MTVSSKPTKLFLGSESSNCACIIDQLRISVEQCEICSHPVFGRGRYTWEQSIEERIAALRAVELERIRATERLMAVNRFMFFSIPVITAVVTFVTFTMLGNEMDASLVFSSMALLNLIQECATDAA